jgi:hypothetical protein
MEQAVKDAEIELRKQQKQEEEQRKSEEDKMS